MGSDANSIIIITIDADFNPRSPHGERPLGKDVIYEVCNISIHAPRMGSDSSEFGCLAPFAISIHAPRMGSDFCALSSPLETLDFNPRSPHGERLKREIQALTNPLFQSTLPAWGATVALEPYHMVQQFQSTLPAWGATINRMVTSHN